MNKISPLKAKELNQNFIKTRAKAIDVAIGKKDAISSWFSLEELKEYIAFIEKEGKEKGIEVNGVRIYFGAYSGKDKKVEKNNLSTVFLVPTKLKSNPSEKVESNLVIESSDITDIDGLNNGQTGIPPSAMYPQ